MSEPNILLLNCRHYTQMLQQITPDLTNQAVIDDCCRMIDEVREFVRTNTVTREECQFGEWMQAMEPAIQLLDQIDDKVNHITPTAA